MHHEGDEIDIVVTWVDGQDPEWKIQYDNYVTETIRNDIHTGGAHRYAEYGLLRYWFRGIDAFAPWASHVFFVTSGQIPKWLDRSNPKLVLVRHDEFIQEAYLPTFNSNTILLNIPRIKGLSERFVLFNDDMYLVSPTKATHFFRNGLPTEYGVLDILATKENNAFWHELFNNVCLINHLFPKKLSPVKFFAPRYGLKALVKNLALWKYKLFPGFYDPHMPNSFLKSFCLHAMNSASDVIERTCAHRFRDSSDITEWFYRYAQIACNRFEPINKDKLGLYVSMKNPQLPSIIAGKHFKYLCINDFCAERVSDVINAFERLFPTPSQYEIVS